MIEKTWKQCFGKLLNTEKEACKIHEAGIKLKMMEFQQKKLFVNRKII